MSGKNFLILLLVVAGGAFVWWYPKNPSAPLPPNEANKQAFEVLMKSGGFEPNELVVDTGDQVTFKNADSTPHWPASNLHPTHGIYPEFDPKAAVAPENEWTFTFDKTGSWKYHDHLSPAFRGTITVGN